MPLDKKSTARNSAPSFDDRKGLGYGTLSPEFHYERNSNSSFPYVDKDNAETSKDSFPEDDLDAFVSKINQGIHITDFMSKEKSVPLSTRLGEIAVNSLVPMPNLYSKREKGATGGYTSQANVHSMYDYPSKTGGTVTTGTEHGFASSLPPINPIDDIPAYTIDDIAGNQEDENKNVKRLRRLIAAIMKEQ